MYLEPLLTSLFITSSPSIFTKVWVNKPFFLFSARFIKPLHSSLVKQFLNKNAGWEEDDSEWFFNFSGGDKQMTSFVMEVMSKFWSKIELCSVSFSILNLKKWRIYQTLYFIVHRCLYEQWLNHLLNLRVMIARVEWGINSCLMCIKSMLLLDKVTYV